MNQLTYLDTLRMEGVLAEARHILAEAEEIALGRKVRITIHLEGKEPESRAYPARVAVYAAQVMGAAALFPEAPKVVFFTQGAAFVTQPSTDGYRAFLLAIIAHHEASLRRNKRELARILRNVNELRKGGQAQ